MRFPMPVVVLISNGQQKKCWGLIMISNDLVSVSHTPYPFTKRTFHNLTIFKILLPHPHPSLLIHPRPHSSTSSSISTHLSRTSCYLHDFALSSFATSFLLVVLICCIVGCSERVALLSSRVSALKISVQDHHLRHTSPPNA